MSGWLDFLIVLIINLAALKCPLGRFQPMQGAMQVGLKYRPRGPVISAVLLSPANFFCENAPTAINDQHHHARIDCGRSNVGERQDCDQEPCERELVYPLAHFAFATGSPSDEPHQARRYIIQDESTAPARL